MEIKLEILYFGDKDPDIEKLCSIFKKGELQAAIDLSTNNQKFDRILQDKKFDLIFVDCDLICGEEAKLLKNTRKINADVPIIFISNSKKDDNKIVSLLKTGDLIDYVAKDSLEIELLFSIYKILKIREEKRKVKEMETKLKKSYEELEVKQKQIVQASKMVSIGTLVASVAHEINNPNNYIMLNASILMEVWEDLSKIADDYYKENGDFLIGGLNYSEMRDNIPVLCEGIKDGASRIKMIVQDLKNYTRREKSNMNQKVNINDMVISAVRLLSNQIKHSTKNFEIKYGMDLPSVLGNFQQLEQVIINLLQNACQALEKKEAKIFLETYYDKKEKKILIRIEDEGQGIAAETIKKIKDPFFTTKRDSGGTGLGLSVSMDLVKSHGGELDFFSSVGKGTQAIVKLPVSKKNFFKKRKSS